MSTVADPIQETGRPPRSEGLFGSLPFSVPAGIAILLGFAPLVLSQFAYLWRREQYQYFPFVLAAFAYMLYSRFQAGTTPVPSLGKARLSRICFVTSLLILIVAAVIQSPWMAIVAMNVFLGGVLLAISQTRHVTNLVGIWLLLWLLVPPPFDLDTQVVVKLQALSSRISSGLLDLFGVNHLMSGNVLQVPDRQFFVDEACSGIVSVMSVIAVGLIWAVWFNRSLLHMLLLVLIGVGWAMMLNVARISTIAFAHVWYQIDLSTGTPHEILGLALFVLTFLALISSDKMLEFVLRPIAITGGTSRETARNPLVRLWNAGTEFFDPTQENATPHASASTGKEPAIGPISRIGIPLAVVFALTGIVSAVPIVVSTKDGAQALAHGQAVDRSFLPEQLGPLRLVEFEEVHRPGQSELGDYSRTFTYEHLETGQRYIVSFDFPFAGGWHELCVCYKNTGWTLLNREVAIPESDDDWPLVTGHFQKGPEEFGYVTFSNFSSDGIGMAPPTDLIFWKPWRRLRRRLLKTVSTQVFQVQVWTDSDRAVSDRSSELADETLLEVRQRFLDYFAAL